MNIRALVAALCTVLALSGCGQKGPSTSTEQRGETSAAAASDSKSGQSSSQARTVEITANDQMKFSVATIDAKPGEQIHVVLTNVGQLPKEAMAHNWILLKSGSDVMAFSAAAAGARDKGYIPDNLKDQIIAHTELVGPHQTSETTFKAPDQPGEYPFLCSFPGHAALMKGTLNVR